MPYEGCLGVRWALQGLRPAPGGPTQDVPGTRMSTGLELGHQQQQDHLGQEWGAQGGGQALQCGLVGLGSRRAAGTGQVSPGTAQLLQVPLELVLAGFLAQRLPDGSRFLRAARQHLTGTSVEVIPGPGEMGRSWGHHWWLVTIWVTS